MFPIAFFFGSNATISHPQFSVLPRNSACLSMTANSIKIAATACKAHTARASQEPLLYCAETFVKQLPHPISWNQWQQLHRDTFTYAEFSAAMLTCFGSQWRHSIAVLPPAYFAVPASCLPQHSFVAAQLPHPITWNQWQQLPGVTSTYTEFAAAMAFHFGPAWKHSILPLTQPFPLQTAPSTHPCPSQNSSLSPYQHVLQHLHHPVTWNDWQLCLRKVQLSSTYAIYNHLMQLTFGSNWQPTIRPVQPQTLSQLRAPQSPEPHAPALRHSRKLRLSTLTSLLSTAEDLCSSLTDDSPLSAKQKRLVTRLSHLLRNAKHSLVAHRLKRASQKLHPNSLANLRPFHKKSR